MELVGIFNSDIFITKVVSFRITISSNPCINEMIISTPDV